MYILSLDARLKEYALYETWCSPGKRQKSMRAAGNEIPPYCLCLELTHSQFCSDSIGQTKSYSQDSVSQMGWSSQGLGREKWVFVSSNVVCYTFPSWPQIISFFSIENKFSPSLVRIPKGVIESGLKSRLSLYSLSHVQMLFCLIQRICELKRQLFWYHIYSLDKLYFKDMIWGSFP